MIDSQMVSTPGGMLHVRVIGSGKPVLLLHGFPDSSLGYRELCEALSAHGLERVKPAPAAQVGGEAATIGAEGGRFISFIGQNAWFHNPRDLWPDAVDIRAVAQFARAIGDLTVSLANTPA